MSTLNSDINGNADFCVHFVKRDKTIINKNGFVSLIVTSSISETDNRTSSFEQYYSDNFTLNFAVPKIIWPGEASLYVSLFTASYNPDISKFIGEKPVEYISPYMDDQHIIGSPKVLAANTNQSFKGCDTGGMGFVLEDSELELLEDKECSEHIWPLLNAREFLNNEDPKHIINFSGKSLKEAKKIAPLYKIVLERVKPYRDTVRDKNSRENWWLYNRSRPALYNSLLNKDFAIINGVVSKYFVFEKYSKRTIFTNALNVFSLTKESDQLVLQSNIHEVWATFLSSSLGQTSRYNPTDIFETYPFPVSEIPYESNSLFEYRKKLMKKANLSYTEFYNYIHGSHESLVESGFYEEIIKSDQSVLTAYGWHEDSEKWGNAIQLRHNFYELDYLPENDRVRYTIHPDARKEVLKRLLLLNHERFEEEVAKGLHKRKDVTAYFEQKGKPIPEGTVFSDGKAKKSTPKKTKIRKTEPPKEQYGLFDTPSKQIIEGSKVDIRKDDGTVFKYHITKTAVKGSFTGAYKQIATSSKLSELMLGKKTGDAFDFGPNTYSIIGVE